jgi:hypothetical protein
MNHLLNEDDLTYKKYREKSRYLSFTFWTNGKVVQINVCKSRRFSGIVGQYGDGIGEGGMVLGTTKLFGGQNFFQFFC